MNRHVITPLVSTVAVAVLMLGSASSAKGVQQLFMCTNPGGQARIVSDPAGCRGNETLVTLNAQGPQGPPGEQGEPGEQGPPGPANRVFGGLVGLNGIPMVTGFSVTHTAGTGAYFVAFPAGTFSGNEGKFLVPAVTPIGTNTFVTFMSLVGRIASDGSAQFEVQFAADAQFSFVVAVQNQ